MIQLTYSSVVSEPEPKPKGHHQRPGGQVTQRIERSKLHRLET